MSLTCGDLLKMNIFSNIRLMAGKDGLSNSVSWPYIKNTKTIREWIYGNELIFETVSGDTSESRLLRTEDECVEAGAAGLVLLAKDEKKFTQKILDNADKKNLPLFYMPYDLKLLTVTKEITRELLLDSQRNRRSENFMQELLHDQFITEEQMMNEAQRLGADINGGYFFAALKSSYVDALDYSDMAEYQEHMHQLIRYGEKISTEAGAKMMSCIDLNEVVCLFFTEDQQVREFICTGFEDFLYSSRLLQKYDVRAGYSTIYTGPEQIPKGIGECRRALRICSCSSGKNKSCKYEEMGTLKFLLENVKKEELVSYCNSVLKELLQSDRNKSTEYVRTLYEYLNNNCNLIYTAQILFMHRNTLVNRINKIQEITGKNLGDMRVRMEFLEVLQILDFYGYIQV